MIMISNKKGLRALSPLFLLLALIVIIIVMSLSGTSIDGKSVPVMPLTVAFLIASIYAVAMSGDMPLKKRIDTYSKGAGASDLLLMLWIYVLAGAFAASAKAIGSIDTTVNLTLSVLPSNLILPGLFLAACFISISIGTSVGTVVALVPIAAGIATQTGSNIALITAIVVGGAYFGDNLSFISDTTVVATQTQHCKMSDKFRVNVMIVAPAALIILIVYAILGANVQAPTHVGEVSFIKVLPYLVVLITAICGMNVMVVLSLGIVLCGIIGLFAGDFGLFGWFLNMNTGIIGMGEMVIIAMMAGGMLGMIKRNGGIDYIIQKLTAHVNTRRGAELSIAALVSLVNICTANNTIAILTVGGISQQIGDRFEVDNRKAASILDTFSCCIQGILPYGVQILLAAGLSGQSPIDILPYLYYPFAIGIAALVAILIRYPKKYS
jgi:Na+/H+ antiporter NhaC